MSDFATVVESKLDPLQLFIQLNLLFMRKIVKRFVCEINESSLGRSKPSLHHFSIKDNEDESDGQKQRCSTDSAMPFWFDRSVETVNFDLFSLHYFATLNTRKVGFDTLKDPMK